MRTYKKSALAQNRTAQANRLPKKAYSEKIGFAVRINREVDI